MAEILPIRHKTPNKINQSLYVTNMKKDRQDILQIYPLGCKLLHFGHSFGYLRKLENKNSIKDDKE